VAVDFLATVFSAGRLVTRGSESQLAPPSDVATDSSESSDSYSTEIGDSTCAGIVSFAQHARTDAPTVRRKRQTHLAGRFVVVAGRVAGAVAPRQFREPLLVCFGLTGADTSRERGIALGSIVHSAADEAQRGAVSSAGLWLRRRLDSLLLGRLPIPVRQLAALATNSALCKCPAQHKGTAARYARLGRSGLRTAFGS
jgi:hypothetical protein